MTATLRKMLNKVRLLIFKVHFDIKHYGLLSLIKKLGCKFAAKTQQFFCFAQKNNAIEISRSATKRQLAYVFPKRAKISVLIPVRNISELFLRETIQSIRNQTYIDWELCVVDGSDENHSYIREICTAFEQADSRIKYAHHEYSDFSVLKKRCIELSTGEYIGFINQQDILHPSALFEVMQAISEENPEILYTDESIFSQSPNHPTQFFYKPDYAPDDLRAYNYFGHFFVFARYMLGKIDDNEAMKEIIDYDLVLQLTELTKQITHIPKNLYFSRSQECRITPQTETSDRINLQNKNALSGHLARLNMNGTIQESRVPSIYRVNYSITENPLISILIPSSDHVDDLENCITSITQKTSYKNYEILIIDNNSKNGETFDYYNRLRLTFSNINVVTLNQSFNYSKLNNFGYQHAKGEYIVLLNNDTEVISADWLQEMLMFAQRKDVGAVGAMLYYPDDTIQHAGVVIGLLSLAGHCHKNFRRGDFGYMGRLTYAHNLSAVTAACMMIPRAVFQEVNGLDESYAVAFNDIDFCLRIRQKGYLIVFTPFAELYHHESKSRGYEDSIEKQKRFRGEIYQFKKRWNHIIEKGDQYYNQNLSLLSEDYSLKCETGQDVSKKHGDSLHMKC